MSATNVCVRTKRARSGGLWDKDRERTLLVSIQAPAECICIEVVLSPDFSINSPARDVLLMVCNDPLQETRVTAPVRTKPSPSSPSRRPMPSPVKYSSSGGSTTSGQETRPRSTSSVGVQSDATRPSTAPTTAVVDGSSNTTPRPPPSPLDPVSTKSAGPDTGEGDKQARTEDPASLISTGVLTSDTPPPAEKHRESRASLASTDSCDVGVATTKVSRRNSGVQVGDVPVLVETSDGGTQATTDSSDVVNSTTSMAEDDGVAAVAADAAVVVVAEEVPPTEEGSSSGSNNNNTKNAVDEPASTARSEPNKAPSIDGAVAQITAGTTASPVNISSENETQKLEVAQGLRKSESQEVPADTSTRVGGAGETVLTEKEGVRSGREPDAGIIVGGVGDTEEENGTDSPKVIERREDKNGAKQEKHQPEEEELGQQSQERRNEDDDGSERSSTENRTSCSPEDSTPTNVAAENGNDNANRPGRNRYESIDGETLLGKLLDESAPSAMFEDDHESLLRKVIRARDEEYVSVA